MVKRLSLITIYSALIALCFFSLHSSYALPEDRNQVAHISADTADLNQQTHRGEYEGDVQFDQGTSHLRSNKVITLGNEKNELIFATAFGSKAELAHFWEQTALDKPPLHAYAEEIRYYPLKHLIELIGHARVVQGEDSFAAPSIRYDTLKQQVITQAKNNERTEIIIHPGKRS